MNVRRVSTKGRKFPIEILSVDDIRKILRACNDGPSGHRNRALIIALWRGGLRISEALNLELRDIDLVNNTLHVRRGKGGKQRTVSIDPKAAEFIKFWLARRAKLPGTHAFCTLQGRPLISAYTRRLFPRLARAAGVEKRVHAHAFRHTNAVELLSERFDISMISRQLGHANITTTMNVYLNHARDPAIAELVGKRKMPDVV